MNSKGTYPGKYGCLVTWLRVGSVLILGYFTFFYPLIEFDRTLVDWRVPVVTGLVVGIIAAMICARQLKHIIALMFIGAFMANSVLFCLNDTFSDRKMVELKLPIKEKYPHYGKNGPHAIVEYKGLERPVNAASDERLKAVKYAVLKVDKGLFGYYIIRTTKLVNE